MEWWGPDGDPCNNIGIDLGRSNLTVLDFDAGDPPANLNLPKTFTVRTGKGQHVYFQGTYPQQDLYFAGKHVGEVKSAGGYVVGPRSLHPTGAVYEPIDQSPIAPLPLDIVEKLTNKPYQPVDASPSGEKIPRGKHDTELHRIAGKLRGIGLEEEAIYTSLVEICEKRCENYGSDYKDMCRKHASNIVKKPVNTDRGLALSNTLTAQIQTPPDPTNWKDYFRSVGQLEEGDVRMIIDGFLPEGINLIGGQAGEGKTLLALSLVKSLTTGEPFLGRYKPAEIIPVIYMIPESSSRSFKMRCKAFRIPDDPSLFICRTVSEGGTLMLDDVMLKEAVKHLKPVVILDTLPRFNESGDENDAAGNKKLVDDITALRALGAVSVIGLHHSTKASAETEMTLQNVLRGTSDLGAMCDSVYALRRDRQTYDNGAGPNEIEVQCVKARDIKNPPQPFKIAATYKNEVGEIVSHIDESGDFQTVELAAVIAAQDQYFVTTVMEDPQISREDLAKLLGTTQYHIRIRAKKLGFFRTSGRYGKWIHESQIPTNQQLPAAQPTEKGE
jgi:AAA domain/Bifunctional DNA primase/polymerase, N-terminal